MQVAIVDTYEKKFLANNLRWYSLNRSQRAAPRPKVFPTKSHAIQHVIHGVSVDKTGEALKTYQFLKPEEVRPTAPRNVSIRRTRGK